MNWVYLHQKDLVSLPLVYKIWSREISMFFKTTSFVQKMDNGQLYFVVSGSSNRSPYRIQCKGNPNPIENNTRDILMKWITLRSLASTTPQACHTVAIDTIDHREALWNITTVQHVTLNNEQSTIYWILRHSDIIIMISLLHYWSLRWFSKQSCSFK